MDFLGLFILTVALRLISTLLLRFLEPRLIYTRIEEKNRKSKEE